MLTFFVVLQSFLNISPFDLNLIFVYPKTMALINYYLKLILYSCLLNFCKIMIVCVLGPSTKTKRSI